MLFDRQTFQDDLRRDAKKRDLTAARSLPVSGHFRTGAGAGIWRGDDGMTVPVVRLNQAGLQPGTRARKLLDEHEVAYRYLLEYGSDFAGWRRCWRADQRAQFGTGLPMLWPTDVR